MAAFTPRDAIEDGPTRTLAALITIYRRDGRATVRAVAAETGRSISTVHAHLTELADRELVTWARRRTGTLRPLVEVVG